MALSPNPVASSWRHPHLPSQFRSAVSLHGHTYYSREILDFIPRLAEKIPFLGNLIQAELDRYRRTHGGADLDWTTAWWTPPLSPQQAWDIEARQIQAIGRQPIVSLTDHDNVDAPLLLRAAHPTLNIPVSVEWTVPIEGTFFHLGVHDLPWGHAREWMARFAAYTAKPDTAELHAILTELHSIDHVLVVFNHPLWDEKGVGVQRHEATVHAFLEKHNHLLHAFELNGLRDWNENRKVVQLARHWHQPVISGGDRHTTEPNACVNLTNAGTFSGFVDEIRHQRKSQVLLMPHYREPMPLRILQNIRAVLQNHPDHALGWTRWSDRVFYTKHDQPIPVGQAWGPGEPWIVKAFVRGVDCVDARALRGMWRRLLPVNVNE